jgi:hypothetical protein
MGTDKNQLARKADAKVRQIFERNAAYTKQAALKAA